MKHYLLTYSLASDYLERRPAFRAEHLDRARAAARQGMLLLGGAVTGTDGCPPKEALLLFAGESPEAAEAFALADPYVTNGLVAKWQVREWITVVGDGAAHRVT